MNKSIGLLTALATVIFSADLFSQDVNPFTGNLNYNSPLLFVPSDRGAGVPIGLNYNNLGIGVNQPASEVGLGWNLSAGGAITRFTKGIPDDINFKELFHPAAKSFVPQNGVLYGASNADIISSVHNLDSVAFYFPNYDSYYVNGPGIGGIMVPKLLTYSTFSLDAYGGHNYDADNSGTWADAQFMFNGDFNDTLISRHYPNTPINGSTPYKMPKDVVSGECYNDASPYYGRIGDGTGSPCAENYDPTTNRLATSNYVEYGTNIYGISWFRITNTAGYVYNYTLPVYQNKKSTYTYPLNNNYSLPRYTNCFSPDPVTGTTGNTFKEHTFPGGGGTYVTEVIESNKTPVEWKLTSIQGPDYQDVNSNGFDAADKGYWVVFEYKSWTGNFSERTPAYGFNYFFGFDEKTANYPVEAVDKRNGKTATANLVNKDLCYLNQIKTSSHKAIFVRDFRQDEVGSNPDYDSGLHDSVKINQSGTIASWHGNIFDEAGYTGTYPSYVSGGPTSYEKTIELGTVSTLTLNIKELNMGRTLIGGTWVYDELFIYAGPNTSSPALTFTYSGTPYSSPFTTSSTIPGANINIALTNYTATAITFKIVKHGISSGSQDNTGFNVEWHAAGKKMPQLHLKRILLYNNDYSLPAITSATTSISDFDLSATTNSTYPLFNETWYQANKTALDANALKGVSMEYDYSLANKYHKNINCTDYYKHTRLSSPTEIQTGLSVATTTLGTGKLTLNKVVYTELGNVQLLPSVKFDYNATVSTDNPDYDPRKSDYSGYYKSDATGLYYYGYTTNVSKDYTDAWSLRKITSQMGGTTEFEYESNSYSKVMKGTGGLRGASRIFPISNLSGDAATPLFLTLEESNSYTGADLQEVYNASAVSNSITADIFIPVVKAPYSYHSPDVEIADYFGTFTYSYNPSAPLPIRATGCGLYSETTADIPFMSCSSGPILDPDYDMIASGSYSYTGNGWIRFNLPQSYTAYGGGIRVKKIINRDGSDAYSTLYEYEDGVALCENDRFSYPVSVYANHAACAVGDKIIPFGSDPYDLDPGIGYSKVKIKKLGQVNSAKGWVEMSFNTTDQKPGQTLNYYENFKPHISSKSTFTATIPSPNTSYYEYPDPFCTRIDTGYAVEYIDKFSPFWGLATEQKVYDVNNNILHKTVYEYESTDQGAIVENFCFVLSKKNYVFVPPGSGSYIEDPCGNFEGSNRLYQTCIKRQYPASLKRTTSYGMGTRAVSSTLKRDEITGEAVIVQTTGDNNTSALAIKEPAFRVSAFSAMGPKALNSSNKNILGADAYSYIVSDSTLTAPSGSASTNFTGASATVYTNTALMRDYDVATNTYTNTTYTLPYWYNSSSFGWAGDVGSVDTYGLYKKSELSANPFNFSAPFSSNSKWRFASEVSLMDSKSHTIETRAFNNKFSATKLDFKGRYVIAQISNCNYRSFTYSGFEHHTTTGMTDGEVMIPTSICSLTSSVTAHTGSYVAAYSGTGAGPTYSVTYGGMGAHGEELGLLRDRVYRASVWTHTASATGARINILIDGSAGGTPWAASSSMAITDTKAVTIGAWTLIYADIKVPADYTSTGGLLNKLLVFADVNGGGTAWFDDLQFHPVESSTAAKVYDPVTGRISADISAEGYATKYTYDAAGRLTAIYKEIPGVGLRLVKTHSYNYARGTN